MANTIVTEKSNNNTTKWICIKNIHIIIMN